MPSVVTSQPKQNFSMVARISASPGYRQVSQNSQLSGRYCKYPRTPQERIGFVRRPYRTHRPFRVGSQVFAEVFCRVLECHRTHRSFLRVPQSNKLTRSTQKKTTPNVPKRFLSSTAPQRSRGEIKKTHRITHQVLPSPRMAITIQRTKTETLPDSTNQRNT